MFYECKLKYKLEVYGNRIINRSSKNTVDKLFIGNVSGKIGKTPYFIHFTIVSRVSRRIQLPTLALLNVTIEVSVRIFFFKFFFF